MKAKITDMRFLSNKTPCFLIFGDVVDVGAGKLGGLPVHVVNLYIYNMIFGGPEKWAIPAYPKMASLEGKMTRKFGGFGGTLFSACTAKPKSGV